MSTVENSKKYRDARIVQLINKFITLKDEDMKRNNEILNEVVTDIVGAMKEKDDFFREHFRRVVFVGSYYKGTKVGKAEEFDLNMIINLPIQYDEVNFASDLDGYTKIQLTRYSYEPTLLKHSFQRLMSLFMTESGYLKQDTFRNWMEGLFTISVNHVVSSNYKYKICVRKSGPAFTLCVKGPNSLNLCVDLAPVLEFNNQPPLQNNRFHHESWYAVPKPLINCENPHIHWRMSFYTAEKDMLKKFGYLKPVIRQLKKLRDTENWKLIASYHIETLFLHELPVIGKKYEFKKINEVELFVHMLNRLKEACVAKEILNYWDENHNLIADIKPEQLTSITGRLTKILKQIHADPLLMASFVLSKEELSQIDFEINQLRQGKNANGLLENTASSSDAQVAIVPPEEPSFNLMNILKKVGTIGLQRLIEQEAAANNIPLDLSAFFAPTNETPSTNNSRNNPGLNEVMDMLNATRNEINEIRHAVEMLAQRMNNVEVTINQLRSEHPGYELQQRSTNRRVVTEQEEAIRNVVDTFSYFFGSGNQR